MDGFMLDKLGIMRINGVKGAGGRCECGNKKRRPSSRIAVDSFLTSFNCYVSFHKLDEATHANVAGAVVKIC